MDDLREVITQLEEDRYLLQLRIDLLNRQIGEAWSAFKKASNKDKKEASEQGAPVDASTLSITIDELNLQLSSSLIERDRLDRRLEGLYVLRKAKGMVKAPVGGTISEVLLRVGDITMPGAIIRITDSSAGSKLVFSVRNEEVKHFGPNAQVSVFNRAANEDIEGAEIASITQNPVSPTQMDITLHLPKDSAPLGATLEVSLTILSETYYSCVPLTALHQGVGGQAFVYVLDEEQTALGTEQIARRVNVTVLASDNRYAAVEGIGGQQLVIVGSAKVLADKDRVLVP